MLFFRSKYTAYYDLNDDSGTRHFAGHRLGCWINAIPANGLLLIPEASAGCACLFSLTATVAFEPRERENVWGVFTAEGPTTPVEHLALNLGGPGDRRDEEGTLWLGYPRPSSRPGLDIPFDLKEEFDDGGRFYALNSDSQQHESVKPRWVCSSGARGLRRCSIPLLSENDSDSLYDITLVFEPTGSCKSEFHITVQGEPHEVSIGRDHSVSMAGIRVVDALTLELADNVPTICGIRLHRADH